MVDAGWCTPTMAPELKPRMFSYLYRNCGLLVAFEGEVAPVGIICEGCWCTLPVSMVNDWIPPVPRTLLVGVTIEFCCTFDGDRWFILREGI